MRKGEVTNCSRLGGARVTIRILFYARWIGALAADARWRPLFCNLFTNYRSASLNPPASSSSSSSGLSSPAILRSRCILRSRRALIPTDARHSCASHLTSPPLRHTFPRIFQPASILQRSLISHGDHLFLKNMSSHGPWRSHLVLRFPTQTLPHTIHWLIEYLVPLVLSLCHTALYASSDIRHHLLRRSLSQASSQRVRMQGHVQDPVCSRRHDTGQSSSPAAAQHVVPWT